MKMEDNNKNSILSVPLFCQLVGLFLIVWYLQLGGRISFLGAIRFEFFLGLGLFITAFTKSLKLKRTSSDGTAQAAVALVVVLFIYSIFSFDRDKSISVFFDSIVKFAIIGFIINIASQRTVELKFLILCIFLAWAKMAQEGFLGWYTGSLMWNNQGIPRLHGSTGLYFHPNSFSGFAIGSLPFLAYVFPECKYIWQKAAILVMAACMAIIILNTGSRTGYVGLIGFIIYYLSGFKTNKLKVFVIACCLPILAVNTVPEEYQGRFLSIFTGKEAQGNSSGTRLQIIKDAIVIYQKYPLGIGLQAFPKVREQMFSRSQDTHNLYLELLTNTGPLGLIVFLTLIYKMYTLNKRNILALSKSIQLRGVSEDGSIFPSNFSFLRAVARAVNGFIFIRLILGIFGMDLIEIYWWLALGLTLAVNRITKREVIV